jgi:hypothetical protein
MIATLVKKSDLLLYPEVMWDRFGRDYAFGWIKRDDEKFDFAILVYSLNEDKGILTTSIISSSAKYSQEFGKRLAGVGKVDHQDCIRIEDHFNIKNKIVLDRSKTINWVKKNEKRISEIIGGFIFGMWFGMILTMIIIYFLNK